MLRARSFGLSIAALAILPKQPNSAIWLRNFLASTEISVSRSVSALHHHFTHVFIPTTTTLLPSIFPPLGSIPLLPEQTQFLCVPRPLCSFVDFLFPLDNFGFSGKCGDDSNAGRFSF